MDNRKISKSEMLAQSYSDNININTSSQESKYTSDNDIYQQACNKTKKYSDLGNVCQEAYILINGDRQQDYGNPEDNFKLIADFWNDYMARKYNVHVLLPRDVAMLMILLKVARETSGYKRDTLVDICGYAGLAEHLQQFE